jgi:hypothetical protein
METVMQSVTVERQETVTETVTVECDQRERQLEAQIEELGRALLAERAGRLMAEDAIVTAVNELRGRRKEIERKETVIKRLILDRDWARIAAKENANRCDKNAAIAREIHEKFREFAVLAMDIEAQRDALRRLVFRLVGI